MRSIVLVAGILLVLSGCVAQSNNQPAPQVSAQPTNEVGSAALSYGAVKKHLKIGSSTQADVLKLLGSPNNMTMTSSGNEIWVYDRISSQISTSSNSSSSGAALGIGSGTGNLSVGAAIGSTSSGSQSQLVSSTRSLTIILEFENEVLVDLLAREGRY